MRFVGKECSTLECSYEVFPHHGRKGRDRVTMKCSYFSARSRNVFAPNESLGERWICLGLSQPGLGNEGSQFASAYWNFRVSREIWRCCEIFQIITFILRGWVCNPQYLSENSVGNFEFLTKFDSYIIFFFFSKHFKIRHLLVKYVSWLTESIPEVYNKFTKVS